MRLAPSTSPTGAATDPAALALLRRGLVAPGLLDTGRKVRERGAPAPTESGVRALEADALSLGYVIGPRLRDYLSRQQPDRLAVLGTNLLTGLATLVGAHVPHLPLFKDFPNRVPASTDDLYVVRMFALLTQPFQATCVLCGQPGTVQPVAPCAHPVCAACWDLETYTGCPICHRRIDRAVEFLDEATWRPERALPRDEPVDPSAVPGRWVLLELSERLDDDVHQAVGALLARRTPLTAQETAELDALLDRTDPADLGWLPDTIEVRTTRAHVLHRLLTDPRLADRLPQLLTRHVTTATDLLRLLHLRDGGDAGLTRAPERRTSPPRRLRRLVLGRLDTLPVAALLEDLYRHRDAWLRAAERLHPFEEPARHPRAALGFAVLRRTVVDPCSRLGAALVPLVDAYPDLVGWRHGRVRHRGWRSRVETALRAGDDEPALTLLAQRPGELLRRTVMLARRTAGADDWTAFLLVVADAASRAAPGVLLSTLAAVRAATRPARPRLYFPAAGGARLWTEPDLRQRLPTDLGGELELLLVQELLRRAAALPATPVAVLDAGLADLVAPFAERTASAALVSLPRGSTRPLPPGAVVRLFLHWTEPAGTRVDLDLSVALYDGGGRYVGLCDYTRLRFADRAAVHSGDLTSAPAPLGASEFVDLDVARLLAEGVHYLVMVVFSYNDVAFEEMTDAFAGFMGQHPTEAQRSGAGPFRRGRAAFQPQHVEQRFDLTGAEKIATPLLVDLRHRRMRWLDVTLTGSGPTHSVARYANRLGQLAVAADGYFGAGFRPSMWELACWHAAARAGQVQVRADAGTVHVYRRQPGESLTDFTARLTHLGPAEEIVAAQPSPATFGVLMHGDASLADAARVYALHPAGLDATRVQRLTAADLAGQLAPTD